MYRQWKFEWLALLALSLDTFGLRSPDLPEFVLSSFLSNCGAKSSRVSGRSAWPSPTVAELGAVGKG